MIFFLVFKSLSHKRDKVVLHI